MFMFVVSICASLLLVVIVGTVARHRFRAGEIVVVSLVAMFVGALVMPVLLVQGFLTLVLGSLCLLARAKPIVLVGNAAIACCIGLWIGGVPVYLELQMLRQMRDDHPFESVAGRLEYESTKRDAPASAAATLTLDVEYRLNEFEKRQSHNWRRRRALYAVHDESYHNFVAAGGFGVSRMRGAHESDVELPAANPIPTASDPLPIYEPDRPSSFFPLALRNDSAIRGPANQHLIDLHTTGAGDFLDSALFGYVKDREHVAGFESHRFTQVPTLPAGDTESWRVVRLELVSLLRYDEPRVYVSTHLPNMNELRDTPTRPLTPFESQALEKLWREDDLVIDESENQIRMLGSLRAGKDCLNATKSNAENCSAVFRTT